jgi:hypothetical protein
MMGRLDRGQEQLFYAFNPNEAVPFAAIAQYLRSLDKLIAQPAAA